MFERSDNDDNGYYPNAAKTVLLMKPTLESEAQELFDSTGIRVLTSGVRYLGGAIGEREFVQESLCRHVSVWCREVGTLYTLAETLPHEGHDNWYDQRTERAEKRILCPPL